MDGPCYKLSHRPAFEQGLSRPKVPYGKFPLKGGMERRRQGEKVLTDQPQEEQRLPTGYSLEMEDCSLLVLRRADGSVVKRFVFSSTRPSPQALRQAAQEDLLSNRRTTELSPRLPEEEKLAEEEGSSWAALGFVLL